MCLLLAARCSPLWDPFTPGLLPDLHPVWDTACCSCEGSWPTCSRQGGCLPFCRPVCVCVLMRIVCRVLQRWAVLRQPLLPEPWLQDPEPYGGSQAASRDQLTWCHDQRAARGECPLAGILPGSLSWSLRTSRDTPEVGSQELLLSPLHRVCFELLGVPATPEAPGTIPGWGGC